MTYHMPDLLYPAEWGFRFFITAQIIFLAFGLSSLPALAAYVLLSLGVVVALVYQIRTLIRVARGRDAAAA